MPSLLRQMLIQEVTLEIGVTIHFRRQRQLVSKPSVNPTVVRSTTSNDVRVNEAANVNVVARILVNQPVIEVVPD